MRDTVTIIDAWGRPVSVSAEDAAPVEQRNSVTPTLLQQSLGIALVAWMAALLAILWMGRLG